MEWIPEWQVLLEQIEGHPGLIFLLGASHSGKSTLARFLAVQLDHRRHVTAFLDGDMGQSTLGPPAALNLALLHPPGEPIPTPPEPPSRIPPAGEGAGRSSPLPSSLRGEREKPPDLSSRELWEAPVVARYFIGSNAPGRHFLPLLVGLQKLTRRAGQLGAEMVVLDSTGFVTGEGARELKLQKLDLLSPQHVVALQRATELEPILQPFEGRPGMRIHRLPIHPQARIKTPEERQANRSHRYADYFKGRRSVVLDLQRVRLVGHASALEADSPSAGADLKGLLVGLNDAENFTLGLGILSHLNLAKGRITLLTPLSDLSRVRLVRLGALKLDPSWHDTSWRPD